MDYLNLAEFYEELTNTSKRLEKTNVIAKLIKKSSAEDLEYIIYLICGSVFPSSDDRKIGASTKIVQKALANATGTSIEKIEQILAKKGDLGLVAEELIESKKQRTLFAQSKLTVKKVFENIQSLAELEGEGTISKKIALISELLTASKSLEAKYIVRTVLEDLRVGVGEGTLRDAIIWANAGNIIHYDEKTNELQVEDKETYKRISDLVQHAYDMSADFKEVAQKIKNKGFSALKNIELEPGRPIKVMLYQKAKDINDALETVGKIGACEYKYDGFRLVIHKDEKEKITLFTRRLENVTNQFPDVVDAIKKSIHAKQFILDSEVIGLDPKTEKWLPFQAISQRIKRKYHIEELIKKVPVIVNIFDALLINDKILLNAPFDERRKRLEKIVKPIKDRVQLAKQIITSDVKEAEKFYNEALEMGNEGIMVKNLEAPYKPGSRVGYGVKVKPVLETLDLVITAAEWGEGKRANTLSSFTIACRDKDQLLEIGKVGTGIKEKEEGLSFTELTKLLKPLIIKQQGKSVTVKPKVVIEINYEEIQQSPKYSSGFALRFPRAIRLRDDKSIRDINDLNDIKRIYKIQRNR